MPTKTNINVNLIEDNALQGDMENILQNVQLNTNCHEKNLIYLTDLLKTNDKNEFLNHFIACLKVPLNIGENNIYVDQTLAFCAKFCISLNVTLETTEENILSEFFISILDFLLKYLDADSHAFRFRACQFISLLLNGMGEHAELDDKLYNEIVKELLKRMQDIKHQVRTQAAIALHRLQNREDPNDPVMKAYLFHMDSDPSPQVRRAIVNNIGRISIYVSPILKRKHDVDERVRRDCYNYLGRFNFKYFKIIQRQDILKCGLTDRSYIVKKVVSQILLPKWWTPFENILDFVRCLILDGNEKEMNESIYIVKLVLDVYFRSKSVEDLIEKLSLNSDKVITNINNETILFWKCLANFFRQNNFEDQLESIIPDLSTFCNLIKSQTDSKQEEKVWMQIQSQFSLLHLLDMLSHFDMSDEVGKINLKKLCTNLLMKMTLFDCVIEKLVSILSTCTINNFLQEITETISDILEPIQQINTNSNEVEEESRKKKICELRIQFHELKINLDDAIASEDFAAALRLKSDIKKIQDDLEQYRENKIIVEEVRTRCTDPEVIHKALKIFVGLLLLPRITKLCPIIRSLQQEFVMEYCNLTTHPKIQGQALRALAMCCYLDLNLAKQNIHLFFLQILSFQYNEMRDLDVALISISAISDFLLLYGVDEFSSEDSENLMKCRVIKRPFQETVESKTINHSPNNTEYEDGIDTNEIISCLVSFLENEVMEIRTLAAECLCKLFIQRRIKSSNILSRLIILWFNPATEQDIELRQIIGVMLSYYAQNIISSQEIFMDAFLPTMKILFDAPHLSPLIEVDLDLVIKFFISHTQPGFNKFNIVNIHNTLAFLICEEIIKNLNQPQVGWLLKALTMLSISGEDNALRTDLQYKILHIFKVIKNKIHKNMINKFIFKHFEVDVLNNAEGENKFKIQLNSPKKVKKLKLTEEILVNDSDMNASIEVINSPNDVKFSKQIIISTSDSEDYLSD